MKKVLEFKFPFYRFAGLDLCNCYASVYLFLQGTVAENADYYCQAMEGKGCNECWACADSLQEKAERLHHLFSMIFDGFWTTQRSSWSGEQTKIQKELAKKQNNFEFLAGFTGYSCKKITEGFKENIIASIDMGKPVIAKVKGETTFRVIIGYDGDTLVDPDYRPAENPPNNSMTYNEIEYIYVLCEKTPQKYTFLDVLKTMEKVMASDAAEGVWGEIAHNMNPDKVLNLPFADIKKRFERFRQIMDMIPNRGHNMRLPFGDKVLLEKLGFDADQHQGLIGVIMGQGHLLHERGYMLTAISTAIIDLPLNDADDFPWDKHGLVTAAYQILQLVIDCDAKILQAIKETITHYPTRT